MMNKRGQGLPMNTIIIAIIVIVVLIAIVVFFLGGFGQVRSSLSSIWSQQVTGDDQTLAIQSCTKWCEQAQDFTKDEQKKSSKFCTNKFQIDFDGDGKLTEVKCADSKLHGACKGVNCT